MIVRNAPGEDFNLARCIGYDHTNERLGAQASMDSVVETGVSSKEKIASTTWHHLVMTSDIDFFTFYLNGELPGKQVKDFKTKFLETIDMYSTSKEINID